MNQTIKVEWNKCDLDEALRLQRLLLPIDQHYQIVVGILFVLMKSDRKKRKILILWKMLWKPHSIIDTTERLWTYFSKESVENEYAWTSRFTHSTVSLGRERRRYWYTSASPQRPIAVWSPLDTGTSMYGITTRTLSVPTSMPTDVFQFLKMIGSCARFKRF